MAQSVIDNILEKDESIVRLNRQEKIFSMLFVGIITFILGLVIGGVFNPQKNIICSQTDIDFSLYWKVYSILQNEYVDPSKIDSTKIKYGTIKGMVASLGDYATVFYDPEETSQYKKVQQGEYEGIGAKLDVVDGRIVIVSPFDGSPAEKAGLMPGDIIIAVDGKDIINKNIYEVVEMIRGEAGTDVTLTIIRPNDNNKKLDIKITRGKVEAPAIALEEIKDGIAVIRIDRFSDSTPEEWWNKWIDVTNQIKPKMTRGEIKGIILDLRGNPGGFLDSAVSLSGDFLPRGSIILYEHYRTGKDEVRKTVHEPAFPDVPLVILVDNGSASASEIFTGAMQYYKRATVIGEKTFGKGTAQIIREFKDGSSLHITIAKWLLPDKRWINQEDPITPDIILKFDYDKKEKEGIDNQLNKAFEVIKKG